MLTVSAAAAKSMLGTYVMRTRVESWRGEDLLDGDVPIASGSETVDTTLNVPERVELTVPRLYRGTSYVPGTDIAHPLAPWGQRLRISVGVDVQGSTEWIRRSWVLVTDTTVDGDTVNVTAAGLLTLVDEAKFISPYQPSGTFASVVRRLVEPAVTVDLTGAPTDRAIPSGLSWDEDRLAALGELLDAWGAVAYITEDGALKVVPAGDSSVSVLALTDGKGGTAMQWGADLTREGAATCVVARGLDSAGNTVQGVAYDTAVGPTTYTTGDFNPLPVPFAYFSPLLATTAQCTTAANTILARRRTNAARAITTTAVPYLALQARDAVTVTSTTLGITSRLGIVDSVTMPLHPASGGMSVRVRLP